MTSIAFVWDNFGPMHVDRCEAVSATTGTTSPVIGIELYSTSDTYDWVSEHGSSFRKVTLFPGKSNKDVGALKLALGIVAACRRAKARHVFLCHYDLPGIFFAASLLRLTGCRVHAMACSKFDDQERRLWREVAKSLFFVPYHGAISSGRRARDYMRFLGVGRKMIANEYNTLSVDRIRKMAGKPAAPNGTAFADRHFTIVARLVEKKNLFMALEAYGLYCAAVERPRPLHLCGSGPLEAQLRQKVGELGLGDKVVFRGFLQTRDIACVLADTLALLLPSTEEQFGNVVIEAQAMGLPVILSNVCGACDRLIRSGINGFVVEPDNPQGLAFFMAIVSRDSELWTRMSLSATEFASRGDSARFAEAVSLLVAGTD